MTPLAAADANHPAVYRDIMVGTELALIISSDAPGYWLGRLQLSWDNEKYATLSGRGSLNTVPGTPLSTYAASCFGPAGTGATVRDYVNVSGIGLELRTPVTGSREGAMPAVPGDWFVVDYRARQTGVCRVDLYDLLVDFAVPAQTLTFTHVPSRDFTGDGMVDFRDFTRLASHWGSTVSSDPNSPDSTVDLNGDNRVDFDDLALFSEYWLEQTDCGEPGDTSSSIPNL